MKNDSNPESVNIRLLETVADIAYLAGVQRFYSGNSRQDMANFIWWAREFELLHAHTAWEEADYMLAVEAFAKEKLRAEGRM